MINHFLAEDNISIFGNFLLCIKEIMSVIQCRETTLPVEILRERELKWIEMLKDWDKWVLKKFKKV